MNRAVNRSLSRQVFLKSRQASLSRVPKALIWVDQAPIRKKAIANCQRAYRDLRNLRSQWQQFEKVDLAAYKRWLHASLGALLTQVRDAFQSVRDKEDIISSVEDQVQWGGFTYSQAYETVMKSFNDSKARDEAGSAGSSSEEQDHAHSRSEDPELKVRRMFEEMYGFNSETDDHEEFERAYERYRQFLGLGEEDAPRETPDKDSADRATRLKERFRVLARFLHPDLNPDLTEDQKSLWIQVQQAYETGDLERLDMVMALSNVVTGRFHGAVSISELLKACEEIRQSTSPLRKKLAEAKKSFAWKFSSRDDRDEIRSRVESELRSELFEAQSRLRELDLRIGRWQRVRKRRSGSQSSEPVFAGQENFQTEFPF